MTFHYSVAVRNARLDAVETAIGVSPILKIYAGTAPADCATADANTVLSTVTLPSDWMANASAGTKSKLGTWEDTSADASGTATHWRIYDSSGTTCHMQGDCGLSGTELVLDSVNFTAGQDFKINSFTLTAGNA